MDQGIAPSVYTCVLLAAGYGSRISGLTDQPKCLLSINHQTLLERNFSIWKELGIKKVNLVLGYRHDLIEKVVEQYRYEFEINFFLNEDYRNLGNTHSLYLGIKDLNGPCLIFDADLAYEKGILRNFLQDSSKSAILVGEGEIDDIECTKTLVDTKGFVRKTVDKRAISVHELEQYRFVGEAIGILKFSREHSKSLSEAAAKFLSCKENKLLNWEHLLNKFLIEHEVSAYKTAAQGWIEIDTPEDYQTAERIFGAH